MKNEKIKFSHYLTLSYKILIKNDLVHSFLFLIDSLAIILQIFEIYFNDFKSLADKDIVIYNFFTILIKCIDKLEESIKFTIIFIIIISLIINYFILNNLRIKVNTPIAVIINITELFFYRVLSLFIFNYSFHFINKYYLYLNLILNIIFIYILINNFYINHLFLFFPNITKYPYDLFSMIIDLTFLGIKLFLSISHNNSNKNISKFCYIISTFTLFFLLIYLSYIMINKSYFLMNNCNLNKERYSIILSLCILIVFITFIDKKDANNIYYMICYINILILCFLFIGFLYDPFEFSKFGTDDNIENVYYYFFIFDRGKNKNFLLEEKIQEHISKCNNCNLCRKYEKNRNKIKEIDLLDIIYNGKNINFNFMNNIIRGINLNGKSSFYKNSFYLINLSYIYYLGLIQRQYNFALNTELIFEIVNSENSANLEEYNICLNQIKYANTFLIKANDIIKIFNNILNENNIFTISQYYEKLAEELEILKYKEVNLNFKNNFGTNGGNVESLPNVNNLIIICSLFYEELFNDSISNSGNYIRESPNILENLVNINNKNIKQITLEINIQNFETKIIRAGGYMSKYENQNIVDLFPSVFKNQQILDLKNLLLNSNNNLNISKKYNQSNKIRKSKNDKSKKNQKIKFCFIIEEKEENELFYRQLKMKLSLIFLTKISTTIYLNGIYILDKDIIVTEKYENKEIIFHYGNKQQIATPLIDNKNNYTIIKKNKNEKYLGKKKLVKEYNIFIGNKKYSIYRILQLKKNFDESMNKEKIKIEEIIEKKNSYENDKEIFIFNDLASQASSNNSSINKNGIINYNKGNKKIIKDDLISKKFTFIKIVLLSFLFIFLIFIIAQIFYLKEFYNDFKEKNNFYLMIHEYSANFDILFFSVLSLVCVGIDDNQNNNICFHFMEFESEFMNSHIYLLKDSLDIHNQILNFTQFLNAQNLILSKSLNNKLNSLMKYVSKFKNEKFMDNFKENSFHFKINQIYKNNTINLILSKENITFSDFFLLMTSRFGFILNYPEDIQKPIYFLNKTGENTFINVYKEKLNAYQENIYLLILDYNNFSEKIDSLINELRITISNKKNNLKKTIYVFISLNLLIIIFIIIILFIYANVYFITILKILDEVFFSLKHKIGDIQVKDIIKQKLYNMKLLLSFYENDINITINNLNKIYNDYQENLNLQLKQESQYKSQRKYEKENKSDKFDCLNILKKFHNNKLLKFSKKRNNYFLSLNIIIILSASIIIICFVIWAMYFKKDEKMSKCLELSQRFSSTTSQLMNNLLIMFLNNRTLAEFSEKFEPKSYLFLIYNTLKDFYLSEKYYSSLRDIFPLSDNDIKFDCREFYINLDNELFNELKTIFINEEEKIYNTMYYFCEYYNSMMFQNFKTLFLQIYAKVKKVMKNFENKRYSDIFYSFAKNDITKIEIFYLISFFYLLDILYTNINNSTLIMISKIGQNLIATYLSFFSLIVLLSFIIFFVYIKNINKDSKKFNEAKKVFKVHNLNT